MKKPSTSVEGFFIYRHKFNWYRIGIYADVSDAKPVARELISTARDKSRSEIEVYLETRNSALLTISEARFLNANCVNELPSLNLRTAAAQRWERLSTFVHNLKRTVARQEQMGVIIATLLPCHRGQHRSFSQTRHVPPRLVGMMFGKQKSSL